MTEHTADPLANLRAALDKVAKASRVIIVHPDRETDVRNAIAETPFPGLFDVQVAVDCPRDRVFLIPKHAPDDEDTTP